MTEQRCPACEAVIELTDECYECLLAKHNAQRSGMEPRTKCKHGHPWTEENTRLKLHKGKHVRECKTCDRDRYQKYYQTKGHLAKKERYAESKQG
jgi:hypothetical protein